MLVRYYKVHNFHENYNKFYTLENYKLKIQPKNLYNNNKLSLIKMFK